MKTIYETCGFLHNAFCAIELGKVLAWLLSGGLGVVVLCTIAPAQDQPQGRSWFMKPDAPAQPPTVQPPRLPLLTQGPAPVYQPPAVKLGQPQRSGVGSSWFMKPDDQHAQAVPTPIDQAKPVLPPQTFDDSPIPQPQFIPTPDDIGSPIPPRIRNPEYSPKVIYRPTLASVLRDAVQFRQDVPSELDSQPPETFVELIGYTIPNCPPCEVAKETYAEPYRGMRVTWKLVEPVPNQKFPCIVDRELDLSFAGTWLKDWPTLWERVTKRRLEAGLSVCADVDDSPIPLGEVRRELVDPICSAGEGSCVCSNAAQEFVQNAYSVTIPANLSIKWATAKDGEVKVQFPGTPPRIRASGWFKFSHNVKSVTVSKSRVLVGLNWWRNLSFEVR